MLSTHLEPLSINHAPPMPAGLPRSPRRPALPERRAKGGREKQAVSGRFAPTDATVAVIHGSSLVTCHADLRTVLRRCVGGG
jgi:hypothetical protein